MINYHRNENQLNWPQQPKYVNTFKLNTYIPNQIIAIDVTLRVSSIDIYVCIINVKIRHNIDSQ